MSSAGPLWGTDLWREVVSRAGGFCQCAGQCGRKHAKTAGRCDVAEGQRRGHLIAAPPVAAPFHVAARMKAPELIALCGDCHAGRTRLQNRSAPKPAAEGLF